VANGTAIVPYSPLGRGFLTGKFSSPKDFEEGDFRGQNARFAEDGEFCAGFGKCGRG
jgi:aryl-alcohol dehydrogenase-like predicted oxidoreductase